MNRITIDPLTRLEGHGRVEIFLDDQGEVTNAYFLVPELRGFESFCVGRPVEEMPRITNRICGLCPEAHHLASVKALDELFGEPPPPPVRKLRELFYSTFFVLDHATHFFVLGGPDLLLEEDSPIGERSIFGVLRALGADFGRRVMATRSRCNHVLELLGGRRVHPVAGLPGGWSVSVSDTARKEIVQAARENVAFASDCIELFKREVLSKKWFVDALRSDVYSLRLHSMGTVDASNRLSLYDGVIRVVRPDGTELVRFSPGDYLEHLGEHVETWTYLKFPFLRALGWQGFTDGPASGVYSATPLARLNAADGMATPLAQERFDEMYKALAGAKVHGRYAPVHNRLATHWARLVELLHAAERMLELARDREICAADLRRTCELRAHRGVGAIEAPRGTLFHDYSCDDRGLVTRVNLIVGTTNNHAALALSVRKVAASVISRGVAVTDALLRKVEVAVRSYDPCLSCATHALPGRMPLEVTIRDSHGRVVERVVGPRP